MQPVEARYQRCCIGIQFCAVVVRVLSKNHELAFGEAPSLQRRLITLGGALAVQKIVPVPDKRRPLCWRIDLQIKAAIASKEWPELRDKLADLCKGQFRALISAKFRFTPTGV